VNKVTEITFYGGDAGDKVRFEVDCDSVSDDNFTVLQDGREGAAAEFSPTEKGDGFLLCYKRGHEEVHGEHHLTLDVKGPTGTGHISSISPTLVKKSEAAEIQLDGPEKTKGRVCFAPSCALCPQLYDGTEYPTVEIPGTVSFVKEANKLHLVAPQNDSNVYKVCYQEEDSCEWAEQSGGLKIRFDPHIKAIDQRCIGANRDATIKFEGAWPGDRVQFAPSCDGITEPKEELHGENKRAMWYAGEALDGLKLCYKPDSSDAVSGYKANIQEQDDILLYIKKVTFNNIIKSFSPKAITSNTANTIYVWGKWQNFEGQAQVGGKVCFAQEVTGCTPCYSGLRDRFDIDVADGPMPGPLGKIAYRPVAASHARNEILCYQAPDSCQWVRQTDKVLQVLNEPVPAATSPATVSSIWPTFATVNVLTSITFAGAAAGDKAIFVSKDTTCDSVRPDKDVGFGEAHFSFSQLGVYLLCYRSAGAHDSVLQSGFNLTVKTPGVTKNMIRPFEGRGGSLDCSTLQLVPHCSMANAGSCQTSYIIHRGVGFRCRWNQELKPAACDVEKINTASADICAAAKCPGSPSLCW